MRFMMLMIPEPYDVMPKDFDRAAIERMMAFNTSMMEAGVLVICDGLHPASSGARVTFETGQPVVRDGPFNSKDVLGGYWIINVASREEAISWATKCPAAPTDIIEVRRIQEIEEFMPDVQLAVPKLKTARFGEPDQSS